MVNSMKQQLETFKSFENRLMGQSSMGLYYFVTPLSQKNDLTLFSFLINDNKSC